MALSITKGVHMSKQPQFKLFLVDDDVLSLRTLEIQFQQKGNYSIKTFSSGEQCLENLGLKPDLIILDYHLNSIVKNAMNGIEALDKIKILAPDIPVVILSAQDKIEVAVDCMHHKAIDYVIKGETSFIRLEKIINSLKHLRKIEKELKWYVERM